MEKYVILLKKVVLKWNIIKSREVHRLDSGISCQFFERL